MVWNLLHIIYVYIGIQHCQFLRFESTLAIPHPRRQRDIGRSVAEENSCLFANNCETVRSSGWRCDRRLKVTAFYGRYWLGFSWAKMAGTSLIHFQSFFSDSVGSSVRENSHWFFLGGSLVFLLWKLLGLSPFVSFETSNWSRGDEMSPFSRATNRLAEVFREFRISCVHLRREREALDALEGKEVGWRFLCKLCRERWEKPGDAGFSGDGRGDVGHFWLDVSWNTAIKEMIFRQWRHFWTWITKNYLGLWGASERNLHNSRPGRHVWYV